MVETGKSARAGRTKAFLFALCLLPLAWLAWRAASGGLGANPIEAVNRFLGDWALRFLLIALAVTPARIVTGRPGIVRHRRMLGLFAFAYATLHITSYVALDQFFDWPAIWEDVIKRRYMTVGMIAFTVLAALAATSPRAVARRLGGRRWRLLHRLVYAAGAAAVLHFAMMVKADLAEPLAYAAILLVLFGVRLAARLGAARGASTWRRRAVSER